MNRTGLVGYVSPTPACAAQENAAAAIIAHDMRSAAVFDGMHLIATTATSDIDMFSARFGRESPQGKRADDHARAEES
jgi:hypothetical protein